MASDPGGVFMNVDVVAIRRVRDHLLHNASATPGSAPADAVDPGVLRRVEPFAEIMYLVMTADGTTAEAERRAVAGALSVLTDGGLSAAAIDALLDRFEQSAAEHGVDDRLARIGAQIAGDREDRETAFTLAAVTALADDRVDWRESGILLLVQEHLGLSDRRVATLLASVD